MPPKTINVILEFSPAKYTYVRYKIGGHGKEGGFLLLATHELCHTYVATHGS